MVREKQRRLSVNLVTKTGSMQEKHQSVIMIAVSISLVDTCWARSYNAVNTLCYTFDAVVSTLECVARNNDDRAVEAIYTLSDQLFQIFDFVDHV